MAIFVGTGSDDTFRGPDVRYNIYRFSVDKLGSSDVVEGSDAPGTTDFFVLDSPGTVEASRLQGVSGIEQFVLSTAGNELHVPDHLVTSAQGEFKVVGRDGDDHVRTTDVAPGRAVTVDFTRVGGADTLEGGAGAETVLASFATFGAEDDLSFGAGEDVLRFIDGGTLPAGGLSGVTGLDLLKLTAGGTLVLPEGLFEAGRGEVESEGAFTDRIDASALTDTDLTFRTGGGSDFLTAGGGDDLFFFDGTDLGFAGIDGGGGTNRLVLLGNGARLDLTARADDIANIGQIDLGPAAGGTLVLDAAAVQAVNGAFGELWVYGDAGDRVKLEPGWTPEGTGIPDPSGGGGSFVHLSQSGSDLYVREVIELVFDMPDITVPTYSGTTTGLYGDSVRMVSMRLQNHMVETPDGAHHVLINLGALGGLTIASSTDEGASWTKGAAIPNTDGQSTSDFVLAPDGGGAHVVYSDRLGDVLYRAYDYTGGDWVLLEEAAVASGSALDPLHPTFAIGPDDDLWTAFNGTTAEGDLAIAVYTAAGSAEPWQMEEVWTFPEADVGAARVLGTTEDVHIVHTAGDSLFAMARGQDASWDSELLLTYGGLQEDPFRTHFSVLADGDDIHVATGDGEKRVVYLGYDGSTGTWEAPRALSDQVGANYMQISKSEDDELYIIYNDRDADLLRVLESTDGGATFAPEAELEFESSFFNGTFPRIETATDFSGDLVVLQQVSFFGGRYQSLVSYTVDVDEA